MSYITEPIFKKLTADEAWNLFSQLQRDHADLGNLKKELDELKTEVSQLKIDNVTLSSELKVNTMELKETKKEIDMVSRKQLRDNQYGRLENVEIGGIPPNVQDTDLQPTVINILKKIDVNVSKKDITACHRLGFEKKNAIVRFTNHQTADKVFANVSKITDADVSDVAGTGRIYINSNLCPEFKKIHHKLKLLKKAGKLAQFGSDRRGAYAQTTPEGRKLRIELDCDILNELGVTPEEMEQVEMMNNNRDRGA